MIVDHNHIKGKSRLLAQSRIYGVTNGPDTITDRYDDRCFKLKSFSVQVYCPGRRSYIGIDFFQMLDTNFLHFDLYFPIFRIYVVELFFSAFPSICFYFCVKELIDMDDLK